ncbi:MULTISPECIES: hypothetical protein [unclassified Campylobacter]|uniref:hypothetical protein n=1 Tax=unclassified Campylobacter TaxID=2593542 RepID=UPI001237A199|nr:MULTISPECIES: hypothetical protein [unclassified Campylobacter]KAA6226738.1 hypothetical protein FMM55_04085 [Campylobacter sp. LR196d]KAA6228666.1 hypothetical protein FMM54_00410 [Campylobacter sp. LR185c]KAA6229069.1 hypothetical protein FMM57_01590 [Campylobacter sp. LR286c]KAA6230175.1 hypothetical protein FMM58_05715 [Campylobacter sp. LR291e]KAA6233696.1 hypothetical protein FMM56_01930 [Campylobacter sp. LR264d]
MVDFIEKSRMTYFLYRSEATKQVGKYNENLFLAEDYEYFLRFALYNENLGFLHENLYIYKRHDNNLSNTKKDKPERQVGE